MSSSLREQAAQKEREWRELEKLQYDISVCSFISFYFITSVGIAIPRVHLWHSCILITAVDAHQK